VEELDIEPVRGQPPNLCDPVPLLEDQDELLAVVLDGLELIEPEADRRRLLADREQQDGLDVVRPVEVVALAKGQLPRQARRDPVLEVAA